METTQFLGLTCVRLANEAISLLITQSVGPRILAMYAGNGENLLAEVPHRTAECPGAGTFHFWGGHRLWQAPEVPERTYLPDDRPVTINSVADGLHVVQPIESQTGLQKSLRIRLPGQTATVVVDHTLANGGDRPVACAPWAITQLKPGGLAILPMAELPAGAGGLQANRALALWPYTDINSPHIRWGNRAILVSAAMEKGALKVGWPNTRGWLAYHRQEVLFVKMAAYRPGATYLDQGSSSECYCDPDFLELETLGPYTTLQPGRSITHREVWQVHTGISADSLDELRLETGEWPISSLLSLISNL